MLFDAGGADAGRAQTELGLVAFTLGGVAAGQGDLALLRDGAAMSRRVR